MAFAPGGGNRCTVDTLYPGIDAFLSAHGGGVPPSNPRAENALAGHVYLLHMTGRGLAPDMKITSRTAPGPGPEDRE